MRIHYRKVGKTDLEADLERLANGQRTKSPVEFLARRAIRYVLAAETPAPPDELAFLERLYSLPDTRGAQQV